MEKKLHLLYHKKRCQIRTGVDESKKHYFVAQLKFPIPIHVFLRTKKHIRNGERKMGLIWILFERSEQDGYTLSFIAF